VKLPGAFWTTLLALIPVIVNLLQGEGLAGELWVPGVIILLGAIAKLAEVYVTPPPPTRSLNQRAPSTAARFLFGG